MRYLGIARKEKNKVLVKPLKVLQSEGQTYAKS